MPSRAAKKSKRDALKRHGTLNPHPDAVTDPLFGAGDFFDRDDLLQLKYEMLRRVTVDKQSVTQSATAFGFSRPTYYQEEADFQRDGLFGLLPEKRGPRQGPARAQAHAGGSGLRRASPGERSFVAPGLGSCHPGTVRYKCASTEYRTAGGCRRPGHHGVG